MLLARTSFGTIYKIFFIGKSLTMVSDAFNIDVINTQRVASLALVCIVSKLDSLNVISFMHCSGALSLSSISPKTTQQKVGVRQCRNLKILAKKKKKNHRYLELNCFILVISP